MLEGFKKYDFTERVPYISITTNGVTFGKGVIKKLGFPAYVRLLLNAKAKQMAIQVASKNDKNAIPFFSENRGTSIRINSRDFKDTIKNIVGFDISKKAYRVEGIALPEDRAVLFDLNKAKKLY